MSMHFQVHVNIRVTENRFCFMKSLSELIGSPSFTDLNCSTI